MPRSSRKALTLVYLASFVFSLHLGLTAYITSSFIGESLGERWVGLIYAGGAILTLCSHFFYPKLLRKLGEREVILGTLFINLFSLGILSFAHNIFIISAMTLVYLSTSSVMVYLFDLLVEHFTKTESVGKTRGLYLTIGNVAWIITPFLSATIVASEGTRSVYAVGFFAMMVVYYLLHKELRLESPLPIKKMAKGLLPSLNRRNIFLSVLLNFFLQFFFAWMVIYAPLYLHEYMDVSWPHIGIIFTIMLTPFVLIEYPLGILADKKLGEKKLLMFGFLLGGLSTLWFAYNADTSIFVLAVILFMSRVGMSIVEIMTETYFFKQVTEADVGVISLFRNIRSVAYITGPILATLVLFVADMQTLFALLGIGMCVASLTVLPLQETTHERK